jgi:PAS domain S-box-containing protein
MLITDPRQPDNPIALINDAFTHLTGYARSEGIGRNCRFLRDPNTDRTMVRMIRERLKAGEGVEAEILNYSKNGSRKARRSSRWAGLPKSRTSAAGQFDQFESPGS